MLSKGFVEAHLRMYLNSDERYRTSLYCFSEEKCVISADWNINQILNFNDCFVPGIYLNILTFDNTIELYSDCIKVYDLSGVLLYEYRED